MMDQMRRALEMSLVELCEQLDRTEVVVFLQSKGILNAVQTQQIESAGINYQCNNKLFQLLLLRCDLSALEIFLESLQYTNQSNLCDIIRQNLDAAEVQKISTTIANKMRPSERLAETVRNYYKSELKQYNPFSLPFTFDIETTWVSLTLRRNNMSTEDHIKLIETAYAGNSQVLYFEGKAATGKTSLMRRIAYDWAMGRLPDIDLVLIAEFRHLRQTYKKIIDLVVAGMVRSLPNVDLSAENLAMYDANKVLLLIDGYDEAIENQCEELDNYLNESGPRCRLNFKCIISSRPGKISWHQKSRYESAWVLGFVSQKQKESYVYAHFAVNDNKMEQITEVLFKLESNSSLNKIAETPLFLTFICLVYEKIVTGTLFELYSNIIWWLIDRYQKDHLHLNVPELCGFEQKNRKRKIDKFLTIQEHFTDFPELHNLGKMCFAEYNLNVFNDEHLDKYNIGEIIDSIGLLRKEVRLDETMRAVLEYVFPHRSIQEFLAGGVYYFWNDDKVESTNQTLLSEIFNSPLSFQLESGLIQGWHLMNELEKFVWMTGQNRNARIFENSTRFFSQYKTVSLDLNIYNVQAGIEVGKETAANNCLKKCNNTIAIKFNFDNRFFEYGSEPINVEPMSLLETMAFSGGSGLNRCPKNDINDRLLFKPLVIISPVNRLQDICFIQFIFPSAQCYVATMEHFIANLPQTAKLKMYSVRINFHGSISFGRESCITTKRQPISEFRTARKHVKHNVCQNGSVEELYSVLEWSRGITTIDLISRRENEACAMRFPFMEAVKSLNLVHFSFSENELFSLSTDELPQLNNITFEQCDFAKAVWSSICTSNFHECSTIRQLSFDRTSFENEQNFRDFYAILQNCHNISFLYINDDIIQTLEKLPQNSEELFDASEVFCELAKNMASLEKLSIHYQTNVLRNGRIYINLDFVSAAGLSRNKDFHLTLKFVQEPGGLPVPQLIANSASSKPTIKASLN